MSGGEGASRTLEDLEGVAWGQPPDDATELVKKIHDLRRKEMAQLDGEDLRLLVGQGIALDLVLPVALDALREEPVLEASLYPGDLLVAVLNVPQDYWNLRKKMADEVVHILDSIDRPPAGLALEIQQFRNRPNIS